MARTFRTERSEEGREFVGTCDEYPSLSWLAATQEDAWEGIASLVGAADADIASEFETWEPAEGERAAGETPASRAIRESIQGGLKDAHEGRVARRDDLLEDKKESKP